MMKPTNSELFQMIMNHNNWFKSRGAAGVRADFSGMDLRGTDVSFTPILCKALFRNTLADGVGWFEGGYFDGADFSGASLVGADFGKASLHSADFTDANLSGANFTNTVLTDAKMPSKLLFSPGQACEIDEGLSALYIGDTEKGRHMRLLLGNGDTNTRYLSWRKWTYDPETKKGGWW